MKLFGGLALASLTKAERGSNSGIGKPGAGRIPNPLIGTNTGPQGLGSNFDGITNDNKVTWDHNTGTIGSDNEDRNKGYLDPGYWCDQREADDTFTLDSPDFLLEKGRFAPEDTAGLLGRTDRLSGLGGGGDLGDRIIGGQNAQEHAWSFIAYFYGCGATLVAKNWAVTAAHCCTIPAWYFKDKDLCFGRDFKNANNANSESVSLEQCAGIAEIIQHPDYDRTVTVMNDICLLKLSSNVQYNQHVQPACLPRQGNALSNDLVLTEDDKLDLVNFPLKDDGKQSQKIKCFVAGWGYRQENKWTSLPDILQDAQVHLFYNETCETAYTEVDNSGNEVQYYVRDAMSCFGHEEGGIDACQGDSGGPLICIEETERTEFWTDPEDPLNYIGHQNPVLRGVVSWGEGCARQGKPGVYARVSQFADWIHDTVKTHANNVSPKGCPNVADYYRISEGVDVLCGHDSCEVVCQDSSLKPNIQSVDCVKSGRSMKGKWSPPSAKVPLLGCAHDPGHFTKCGAITSEIDVEDLDKMTIQCTTYLCKISPKVGFENICEPSAASIKCINNRGFNYEYPKLRCEKPKSTTKCGPVYQAFPQLEIGGYNVVCTTSTCTVKHPEAASVNPSTMKCRAGEWEFRDTTADEVQFQIETFGSLNEDVICTTKDGSTHSLKQHAFDRFYIPHDTESEFLGWGPVTSPKPTCITKGVTEICVYQCPRRVGGVGKTGRPWKCHSSKGWLPKNWTGKLWCHHIYSKDGSYDVAKQQKSLAGE